MATIVVIIYELYGKVQGVGSRVEGSGFRVRPSEGCQAGVAAAGELLIPKKLPWVP